MNKTTHSQAPSIRRPPLERAEVTGRAALASYAQAAVAGWLTGSLGATLAISLLAVAGAMEGDDVWANVTAVAGGLRRVDRGAADGLLGAAARAFVACGDHQHAADALEFRNAASTW